MTPPSVTMICIYIYISIFVSEVVRNRCKYQCNLIVGASVRGRGTTNIYMHVSVVILKESESHVSIVQSTLEDPIYPDAHGPS